MMKTVNQPQSSVKNEKLVTSQRKNPLFEFLIDLNISHKGNKIDLFKFLIKFD